MTTRWLRSQLLVCQACLQPLDADTPYATWINTGKCRRCLIGRSDSGNECSWCLDAYGVPPKPDDSHGICARHEQEMMSRIEGRR